MEDNWNNPEFARHWSTTSFEGNPCRPEQLNALVTMLAEAYKPGTAILDLGFGSGLVEKLIFHRIPDAYVVGVEKSPAMVHLAQENLESLDHKYEVIEHDLVEIDTLKLPQHTYSAAITVQTLHHIPDEAKLRVFRYVHTILDKDGVFIVMDRTSVPNAGLYPFYKALWKRQARTYGSPDTVADTYEEYLKEQDKKADFATTLDDHLAMLRQAGFEATCVHLHAHRAVIVAVKAEE